MEGLELPWGGAPSSYTTAVAGFIYKYIVELIRPKSSLTLILIPWEGGIIILALELGRGPLHNTAFQLCNKRIINNVSII